MILTFLVYKSTIDEISRRVDHRVLKRERNFRLTHLDLNHDNIADLTPAAVRSTRDLVQISRRVCRWNNLLKDPNLANMTRPNPTKSNPLI